MLILAAKYNENFAIKKMCGLYSTHFRLEVAENCYNTIVLPEILC